MALGGRVSEELVFGEITTGARADLENVTKTARSMVTRYGMSERLGPMIYGQKEELVFLGREIGEQRDYSESVAEEIDAEVRRIVAEAYERARQVLTDQRDKLDLVARRLLEIETLDREAFVALMEGLEDGEPVQASDTPPQRGQDEKSGEEDKEEDSPPALDMPTAPAPA